MPAAWGMAALRCLSQVSDSSGPLNQCPRGQRILALSSGPSVDRTVYRPSTSAGSPHRSAPCLSMYAGQSRNIMWVSIKQPPFSVHRCGRPPAPDAAHPGRTSPLPVRAPNGTSDTPGPVVAATCPAPGAGCAGHPCPATRGTQADHRSITSGEKIRPQDGWAAVPTLGSGRQSNLCLVARVRCTESRCDGRWPAMTRLLTARREGQCPAGGVTR